MTESSRTQGLLICAGSVLAGVLFLAGLLARSWWAVALPVGVLLAFVLGLTFWVGWTIATVQVEPEPDPDAEPSGAGAPSSPDRSA
jgi:hypothetical protein